MDWELLGRHVLAAIVFGALGLVVFVVAMKIIVKVSPFSVKKEIEEDQNVALAIVMGSIFLGLAVIVAAAVAG
jgi:putative membrane protein